MKDFGFSMWNKVGEFISRHKLLDDNELYLVALSGGADSVALLLLLHEAGYKLHAAHCNFHLRGAESDRDEAFCETLCSQLGVALHKAHFDTKTYAELHKVSIEMAARELRYRWFGQLSRDLGAAAVCVAHHRDDSVETVLLNLVRGTGLRGLTGIQPKSSLRLGDGEERRVDIVRPLLCVSRAEIEGFLTGRKQQYVTDSTNLEADVQRNKIRLQVLPLLRTLNPAVAENIQRTASHLAEAQAVLDAVVDGCEDGGQRDENGVLGDGNYQQRNGNYQQRNGNYQQRNGIYSFGNSGYKQHCFSNLSDTASSKYLLFEWLKRFGFNGSQATQLMEAETGAVFSSPTGYEALKDRGRVVVEMALKPMKNVVIPEDGTYVLDERSKLRVRRCAPYVSRNPLVATLDAARVHFPLTVRRVAEGDRMVPYGMKGSRLLSDLMTDAKMTLFEKRRQLLVADAQGVIVWAVGLRTSALAAVTEDCREVLELQVDLS